MKRLFIICLFLLIFHICPCSASCSWQGIDAWSGDEWQALQPASKPAFLQGMIEGLKFRGPDMGPWEFATEDVEDYIPAIDRLYEDQENRDIPIVLMLDYINCKFVGMGQEELDFRLEDLRRIARVNAE